jgi:methionyl-tRNA formyltransferase
MDFAALGRTRWLRDAIVRAAEAGHRPALIGTAAPSPEYGVVEDDFRTLAAKHGCPFFADARINTAERVAAAKESGAAVAISVNWPIVIGKEMRAAFAHGVVNAHAGDLPRYRGNACPNWAIIAGEPSAFATLHRMGDGIDDGPIFLQRSLKLSDDIYIGDVYRFLDDAIPAMFVELLDGLAANRLRAREQPADPAQALRCFPRRESDSEIVWSQPAEQLARLVRASAEPFSGAFPWLDGARVRVWRARAAALPYEWHGAPGQVAETAADGSVTVLCGAGVLVLQEIEVEGAGRGPAARFVRSNRARFGIDAAAEIEALRRRIDMLEGRSPLAGKSA